MFHKIHSLEEMEEEIKTHQLTFLYISRQNCSVCHSLKPQIIKILDTMPDIAQYEMDADEVPTVAGRFQVFTVPVLLLFVDGKEYLREARIVNTGEFEHKIKSIVAGVQSLN